MEHDRVADVSVIDAYISDIKMSAQSADEVGTFGGFEGIVILTVFIKFFKSIFSSAAEKENCPSDFIRVDFVAKDAIVHWSKKILQPAKVIVLERAIELVKNQQRCDSRHNAIVSLVKRDG